MIRLKLTEERWSQIGLSLALLWILQAAILPKIQFLEVLQSRNDWRLATGSLLFLGVSLQWLLFGCRVLGFRASSKKITHWHYVGGALAPLGLYLHSSGFGYGVLGVLTAAFLLNTILGACNKSLVKGEHAKLIWKRSWLPAHILLSLTTSFLVLWHLYLILFFHSELKAS